jgi:putative hydrolase of the HAD superfamily
VGILRQRLRNTRAFVFDFYATLAGDRVSVPPLWRILNELGYRSHPALEAMFEPDAFDGTLTPRLTEQPAHDEWLRGNWRSFALQSGVPPAEVDDVLEHLLSVLNQYRACAMPGAHQLLTTLGEHGFRIGLCSNWESEIGPFLEQADLSGFDAIVTSSIIGARKPHPAMFATVAKELGATPEEIIFVGDNWSADIVGALRAGMSPMWIRNGRRSMGLTSLVAEYNTLEEFRRDVTCLLRSQ